MKLTHSKQSKVFFISDTHFGHNKIIEYCKRPFKDANEMDEAMIHNWNSEVGNNDYVIHDGDFCFSKNYDPSLILNRLNGNIILIEGNHDDVKVLLDSSHGKIIAVRQLLDLRVNEKNIVCCHYPLRSWNKQFHGSWHVYGHVHDSYQSPNNELSYNVGVEWTNYTPLSFDKLAEIMSKKEIRNENTRGV